MTRLWYVYHTCLKIASCSPMRPARNAILRSANDLRGVQGSKCQGMKKSKPQRQKGKGWSPWGWRFGPRHARERSSSSNPESPSEATRARDISDELLVNTRQQKQTLKEKGIDRWSIDWPEESHDNDKLVVGDRLGDHTANRYRCFRRAVEKLGEEKSDQELFGMLLSAESILDDMRVFEKEKSALIRLAQTGSLVRQLRRLHAILDAATAHYEADLDETMSECVEWQVMLIEERRSRAAWYLRELKLEDSILATVDTEANAEEVMTLLKAAISQQNPHADAIDALTVEELSIMKTAFGLVAEHVNVVIMALPSWFALPSEFGATFGLSTWGSDRFVPEHEDEERFIREASGWSELNHPHVAKFLGACHVGSKTFIAHEKVRPMTAYTSIEGTERKTVWHRMLEVGLALQFVYERGFSSPQVKAEQLYCAQYEDRVVLFGVHLFNATEPRSGIPQDGSGRLCDAKASVESLVIAIGKIFKGMATDFADDISVASIPTAQPSYLNEQEWSLLKKLFENTSSRFLQAIEVLRELAEVRESYEWREYVPRLQLQAKAMRFVKEARATIMGETIDELLTRCRMASQTSHVCISQLVERFDNVCSQLQRRKEDIGNWDTLLESIAHYCNLLHRFSSLSAQKARTSSQTSQSWAASIDASVAYSQRVMHQLDPGRVYSLHSRMDKFLALYQLSSSDKVHKWIEVWQAAYSQPSALSPGGSGSAMHNPNQLFRWFIPHEQIDFEEFEAFSEGAFGSVHKGKWFETPVIVKRIKLRSEDAHTQFCQEADVWFQLNHINVVKMYGACDVDNLFFVCEYASEGDLDKYLDRNGRDPYRMWYCLLNAALGLQYLHSNDIVHADLKANNILVGADGVAKLTDFGLSVRASDSSTGSAGALGAYQWKAPECLSGSVATFPSDVYSFAMVIIEVIGGSSPWGNNTVDAMVKHNVKKGLLPPRPSIIDESEWRLIEQMCAKNPAERISMDAVVLHLSSLLQRLDQEQLWYGSVYQEKTFSNHFASRDGVMLSLIELSKSRNGQVAVFAGNQFVSIARSRDGTSNQQELNAIVGMLLHGTEQQKFVASRAIAALASGNLSALKSGRVISALVTLIANGTVDQKEHATNAIANLAGEGDISDLIIAANGIKPLVKLLRDGDSEQKEFAAIALYNLTFGAKPSEIVVAAGGVNPLVRLVRSGTATQKDIAVKALARLSTSVNIGPSVLTASGIDSLISLIRNGTEDQKTHATMTIVNLAASADISEEVLYACGVDPLVILVSDGTDSQKELAAQALSNLCASNKIVGAIMASRHAIKPILQLMRDGTDHAKTYATKMLAQMSSRANIGYIVAVLGGIAPLIQLMNSGTDDQKEQGALVLAGMAAQADIGGLIVSARGIEALMLLLRSGTDNQKCNASLALGCIALRLDISEAVVAQGGIELLVELVQCGTDEQKRKAAISLDHLAMHADISAPVLATNGIESLVNLIRDGADTAKTAAVTTLGNLSARADVSEPLLAASGIGSVIELVRNGAPDQKRHAVRVLATVSVHVDISEPVLASQGLLPLVQIIQEGTDIQKILAVRVLANMSARTDILQPMADANGVQPLLQLLRNGTDEQKHAAKVTLDNLNRYLDKHEAEKAVREIGLLVTALREGSDEQKKRAAQILASVSSQTNVAEAFVAAGGVDPLMQLVRTGTEDQKTAALIALSNLSSHKDILDLDLNPSDFGSICQLLRYGNNDQRRAAARILANDTGCNDYLELAPGGSMAFK